MRVACRLINGDGFAFEYATIDLTADYAAWLLELATEAAQFKATHDTFYAVELFDSAVEYGSALGSLDSLDSLDDETSELIDSDGESRRAACAIRALWRRAGLWLWGYRGSIDERV